MTLSIMSWFDRSRYSQLDTKHVRALLVIPIFNYALFEFSRIKKCWPQYIEKNSYSDV